MRNYSEELEKRVAFIQEILQKSKASGIVFGNSGGKDSALVGILCKKACEHVTGVILPCRSVQNYQSDRDDALELAKAFSIDTIEVDLSKVKDELLASIQKTTAIIPQADVNIAPRLRMTTLYTIGQSKNYLVAGTGNKSEAFVGYFTKWGDGAYDFNPIGDLTVTEVFEFLRFLKAPESIINKAPSAGLYEGQTDEKELGVSYAQIDEYIQTGQTSPKESEERIHRAHSLTQHKREPVPVYRG